MLYELVAGMLKIGSFEKSQFGIMGNIQLRLVHFPKSMQKASYCRPAPAFNFTLLSLLFYHHLYEALATTRNRLL